MTLPDGKPVFFYQFCVAKKIIMKTTKYTLILLLWVSCMAVYAQKQDNKIPVYKDRKESVESRIKDLLNRMTIEEKAGQLNQLNGGNFLGPALNNPSQQAKIQMIKDGKISSFLNITGAEETMAVQKIAVEQSRLGIPILFGLDVIHGYKTIFPVPLAEACSWDLKQIEQDCSVAAKEAASAGLHWTFAPMCDLTNDPRWGRIMEGAGEDPFYGGLVAVAKVHGFQGNLSDTFHLMACVKHYGVYGAVEAGRDYNNVDISRVALWNKYLPPYKAAVEAGAATVMNSFNVFEGVPASGNKYLVQDILKTKWGFKGFLVSDWGSFGEMVTHGYAADKKDAVYKAIMAGSMMDMESKTVVENLPQLVKEGKISIKQVDDAVSRILYFKFKLGLFENPYRFSDAAREKANIFTAENRQIARESARKSIVLLKNDNQILPVSKTGKKIALIGYYANSKQDMFDMWQGKGEAGNAVTIYEGLKSKYGNISFSDGYKPDATTSDSLISAALHTVSDADVILVNIGLSGRLGGEDKSLSNIQISDGQVQLLKALQKTGKPIVALVSSGRPMILTQIQGLVNSIVQCWNLGTETGNAIADVLSGDYNPSGKTVVSFPYSIGQIPVYYNHFNTGRPQPDAPGGSFYSRYLDIPNEPLYPFGFGLSYTNYAYSNLSLSSGNINKDETLQVSITVRNTGKYDGEEVVQLYIQDVAASIVRPVKELKAFQKVVFKAGEEKVLNFNIGAKELSFYNAEGDPQLESGDFKIFVGGSSNNTVSASFHLN